MFQFWFKSFPQIPAHHPDHFRAIFIYYLLLFLVVVSATIGLLNLVVFNAPKLALIDLALAATGLLVYWFFRSTAKVDWVSWLLTLILVFAVATYLTLWSGNNFGVIWVTVVPPVAFFLLGTKAGSVVTTLLFCYVSVIIYQHINAGQQFILGYGALFNVIEVCTAQVLLFRFYERNRASALAKLQENRKKLEKLASTDKLTGLNNRQKFDKELNQAIQFAEDNDQPLSLLLIDIDYFKNLNDRNGHLFGDEVLRHLAVTLSKQMRKHDVLARWGGEEFVALMPGTTQSEAKQLAERLRQRVAEQTFDDESITVSCGVAILPRNGDAEAFIAEADRALYQAKKRGRNCVVTA